MRITNVVETQVVNHATGEVTEEIKQKSFRLEPEPNYIKVYLADIMYLSDMPTKLHAVLFELLKVMEFDTNMIAVNSSFKKRIADRLEMKKGTIDNALTKFCKAKILERTGRGDYRANPYLFGKGKWTDIKRIRLEISYDSNLQGRTFRTSIEQKDFEEQQDVQHNY